MTQDIKAIRAEIIAMAEYSGLELSEAQIEQLCESYPHVQAMIAKVPRDWSYGDEPAGIFEFPREG